MALCLCIRGLNLHRLDIDVETVGHLEYHYPVALSSFNLAAEAPVTFTRTDDSSVCFGVPWDELILSVLSRSTKARTCLAGSSFTSCPKACSVLAQ